MTEEEQGGSIPPMADGETQEFYLLHKYARGCLCLRQSNEKCLLGLFLYFASLSYCPDLLSLLQPPPTYQELLGFFFSPHLEFPKPVLQQHIQEIICLGPGFLPAPDSKGAYWSLFIQCLWTLSL